MLFEALDKRQGSEHAGDVLYAQAPLRGVLKDLKLDLFLPHKDRRPAPCLVWLQDDGGEDGPERTARFHRLARWCAQGGFALIVPEFRQGAVEADLEPITRQALPKLSEIAAPDLPASISGPSALAAMEDIVCALVWLEENGAALGLRKFPILGGGGFGAFTAFHTVYAALTMGHQVPRVSGLLSFSGGLAWPSLFMRGRMPIFALHNPADPTYPITTIREIAQADPSVELIEGLEHKTGAIKLWPGEGRAASHARILSYLEKWDVQPAQSA
jgi:dienelactone hydrolase